MMPGQINGEYKNDAITSQVYTITRKFEWKRRGICSTSIFEDNIKRMDDTRDPTQNCEENVDQEISAAPAFQKHPQGWDKKGEDDFKDVGAGHRHCYKCEVIVQSACWSFTTGTFLYNTSAFQG